MAGGVGVFGELRDSTDPRAAGVSVLVIVKNKFIFVVIIFDQMTLKTLPNDVENTWCATSLVKTLGV